ncbi:C-terminal binding protein [Gracilibacillus sp. YIM 98692]|uniref:C-terminal binding protein n=1 Tax=Gracilibacillus sp. YIM 98692 TaxID=2663532 RepID=UPI0013D7C723|nr:C-terminal binding protein [Gracilibacillus sp. YIM 98692]
MTFKVVVSDYEYKTFKPELDVFEQYDITFEKAQCQTEDEVIEACKDADAILNQYAPITRKVIERLPNLKAVARYGVGVNTVDLEAATENQVLVCNVTDYCMDEVSDHAIAMMLSANRKVTKLNNRIREGVWDFNEGVPIYRLKNTRLGLVGFGRIAQQLAEKAKVFGMDVAAYDPFIPEQVFQTQGVASLSLEELCETSNFLSVHVPLTNETENLIDHSMFQLMQKDTVIVNTSRGGIINEDALYYALKNDQIAGAALDVLAKEPIDPQHPLLQLDNVLFTPHIAWYSEESQEELKRKSAENIAAVHLGKYPKYLVNEGVTPKLSLEKSL